jgi:hypothetical protein
MTREVIPGGGEVQVDFSRIEKMLKGLAEDHYVDIGVLGSGAKGKAGDSVAEYAAKNEFGVVSKKIPERSFIRMPLTEKAKVIERAGAEVLSSRLAVGDVKGIFKVLGVAGEAAIQEAFDTRGFGKWKGNAPMTIEKKGSDSPLIDTGTLRKSITSRVK